MSEKVERNNYKELGLPVGPYVHCVKHNSLLYLSGLTAYGTDAQEGSLEEQTRSIFDQISLIATREGSSLANLISVLIHVTDIGDLSGLRDALFDIYGSQTPVSTLVEVSKLFAPGLKVEITATIAA